MIGGLGRHPHPDTAEAARRHPVGRRLERTTSQRHYWWQGGAWLDQGMTGTCVGNAFAHRRADDPEPVAGIDEAWARELYVAASGDTTLQEGTNAILACRVLQQRGIVTSYDWVSSPEEMRAAVLTLGTVCVGVTWFESMYDPVDRYGNSYLRVDRDSGVAGGHEFVINGIDLAPAEGPPFYRMKNSWGRGWGHLGTARIRCESLEWLLFEDSGDAVVIQEIPSLVKVQLS